MKRLGGFALLEMMVAVALLGMIIAFFGVREMRNAQRASGALIGGQLLRVAQAASEYVVANRDSLLAQTGPATAAVVPVSALTGGGYLRVGWRDSNAFGQGIQVRINQPKPGQLDFAVMTVGGTPMPARAALAGVRAIGFGGFWVRPSDPANATGPAGSIALDAYGGTPGVGHLVYVADVATTGNTDDNLKRSARAGEPERNRMNTAIDMSGNDIANAGLATARKGVVAGAIAVGTTPFGTAQYPSETIQLSGGNLRLAVGSRDVLVAGGDGTTTLTGNGTIQGALSTQGLVTALSDQHVNGTFRNFGNAEFYNNVTANGNITTNAGTVSSPSFRVRGNGGISWDAFGGGLYMSDASWVRVYGDKNIVTGGEVQAGRIVANGRATFHEYAQFNGLATAKTGCSPNGLVGRDSTGALLSCKNGLWEPPGGGISGTTVVAGPQQSQGPVWAYAQCPDGTFLVGGGYNVTYMEKASSQEAPQVNRPVPEQNAWGVYSGGSTGGRESRFLPYAICAW
ncbi:MULTISPECIES: shufflon system plasmid conjugative transfer pilus tip adhesin PilV [Xanthomonas]|uniref:shufflon system plasmid conjugative transfer pilus tip adhesin PilV n=1 Tax=Xanthomonas TaxID=338 RepID=UPI0009B93C4B|nr:MULTISPECIES: shufflon system plasmid conjugative transfer pilus tip adhesin PilV [Xanthomonas]